MMRALRAPRRRRLLRVNTREPRLHAFYSLYCHFLL